MPMASDFISRAYKIEPPQNEKPRGQVLELLGWGTPEFGESGMPEEGMEAPRPFPIPCLLHLFRLGFPELYPFITNQ